MFLLDCLCLHVLEFCDFLSLGQLCCTARDSTQQTKRTMVHRIMQTKIDVDQLCARHNQDFPSPFRVNRLGRKLQSHGQNHDLFYRANWIPICRLQCCLSHLRKTAVSNGEGLTLRATLRYLKHGTRVNFSRIDEYTLVDFYNEVTGNVMIDMDRWLEQDYTDAIALFAKSWSQSCVEDLTLEFIFMVLFNTVVSHQFMGIFDL